MLRATFTSLTPATTSSDRPAPAISIHRQKIPCKLTNAQLAKILQQQATIDCICLENSLAMKWTWGTDLNANDIHDMLQGADKGNVLPHSGYDDTIPWGNAGGDDSKMPSVPKTSTSVQYLDISFVPITEIQSMTQPTSPLQQSSTPMQGGQISSLPSYPKGLHPHALTTPASAGRDAEQIVTGNQDDLPIDQHLSTETHDGFSSSAALKALELSDDDMPVE